MAKGKLWYISWFFIMSTAVTYFTYILMSPEDIHPFLKLGNVTMENSPHYLIHTPGCVIPYIDPFHPSLLKYKSKNPQELVCSKEKPLTEESGLNLIFYKERASLYRVRPNNIKCSYQGILRVEQDPKKYNNECDNKWKLKESVEIIKRKTHMDEDGIFVTCVNKSMRNPKPFYRALHLFIQPSRVDEKRKKFQAEFGERKKDQLSVILMGLDSVSRGNLQRHMPLTFDYVTKHLHLMDMLGFNKVGDNTDPNLSAILMGMSYKEVLDTCTPKEMKRFDDCPLIWKNFSAKGYPTIYAEDSPWMGIYHFKKAGFCKQPTDYYSRPYFYASDKTIGISNGRKSRGNYCQGGRRSISIIQGYSLAVAEALRDLPYFGLFWSSSVSHGTLGECSMADKPTLNYLKKLNDRGYLNHTVLLFISDHGVRFGKFRSTYAGVLEERLPYVMFGLPKWFQERYPVAVRNLRINTKRLTSSFDLHATLHDILNMAYLDPAERSYHSPLPDHGQSLFLEVPSTRTCEEAGIPDHFCTCTRSKAIDANNTHLQEAANHAIYEINKGLKKFPDCVQLSLDKVLNGRLMYPRDSARPKWSKTLATAYFVVFVTQPGGATMESTLRYHEGKYDLTADVSRISKYGNQSHCIGDQVFVKYCLCKDMLPLS